MAHKEVPWGLHPFEIALGGPLANEDNARELARHLGVETQIVTAVVSRPHPLAALELLDHEAVVTVGMPGYPTAWLALVGAEPGVPESDILGPPLAVVGAPSPRRELPWAVPVVADLRAAAGMVRDHWARVTAQRPLFGLVLTGGQSTRMGQDKAGLGYGGEAEAARVYRLLEAVCDRVYVSCRADQADLPGRKGLPQIHDSILGKGPVSGLLSAFEAQPEAACLAVACDLPRVDGVALASLVDGRNPFRFATAFRGYQDLPEPLCALWEPKAKSRLYQFLAAGYDCPRKVLVNSPITLLEAPEPGTLTNVNTPEERQEVLDGLDR